MESAFKNNRNQSTSNSTFRPIPITSVIPNEHQLIVQNGDDRYHIREKKEIVLAILQQANGYRTEAEIIESVSSEFNIQTNETKEVIDDLVSLGVLKNSSELYQLFMDWSDNPTLYSTNISGEELYEHELNPGWKASGHSYSLPEVNASPWADRRSCRGFEDTPLPTELIATLLHNSYSQLPSGGALQPIRLALILNKSDGQIPTGIYHYDFQSHTLVFCDELAPEEVAFCLNREDCIYNAPVVFVISADFSRQAKKYSSRGARYTLIEAGMITQRLEHLAQLNNIDTLIFGGYDDRALSYYLYGEERDSVRTVLTIAFGIGSSAPIIDNSLEELHARISAEYIGSDAAIEGAGATNRWRIDGDLSFHQVLSQYTERLPGTACSQQERVVLCGGTAPSILNARIKAIVEALERRSSRNYRVDVTGAAIGLKNTVAIEKYIYPSGSAWKHDPALTPFDPNQSLEWVYGRIAGTDQNLLIPVDLVFYPLFTEDLDRKLLYRANSSGVASHTNPEVAIRSAFLELIERDAVLRSWYYQVPPHRVSTSLQSHYIRRRANYWSTLDYTLDIFNYSKNGIPIAGALISSANTFPAFSFGSAAAEDWNTAIVKALHEAEVGIASYRAYADRSIKADSVVTPLDHGRYHAYDPMRTARTFLLSGGRCSSSLPPDTLVDESIMKNHDAIIVKLADTPPVLTYRVLSPTLLTINFGTYSENRPADFCSPKIPHFIA